MPIKWEAIQDASLRGNPVWFARPLGDPEKGVDPKAPPASTSTTRDGDDAWQPLRHTDCHTLNNLKQLKPTYIECGRSTADPVRGIIFYNFFRGPERELINALWFIREDASSSASSGKEDYFLYPITNDEDATKIETLYKRAVASESPHGQGIDTMLDEEAVLHDGSKVQIKKRNNTVTFKRTPAGWFAASQTLQRGYLEYEIPGEEEENLLGPVKSLVFVVHGIGEYVFSRDDVKLPSITEQMNVTRAEVEKRQIQLWKEECTMAEKRGQTKPPPPNRIEFIPIEWFNTLHDSSTELMKSLQAVTLQSIPALRGIANDIIFDVLLYLTPIFCTAVLDSVTSSVQTLLYAFKKVHPEFEANGGKCSFIGHSLGSVIVWDLLSILQEANQKSSTYSGLSVGSDSGFGFQGYGHEQSPKNKAIHGTWGPSLTKKMEQTIPFTPEVTILLGSPLGMFLTLRGAHAVFDAMLQDTVEEVAKLASIVEGSQDAASTMKTPHVSPFSLPTGSLYNIFNLSDPIAYRVEPLLLAQDTAPDSIPPPCYLTAPGKDVRLHLRAKQLGEDIRKSITSVNSLSSLIGTAVSAVSVLTPDSINAQTATESKDVDEGALDFPLGGKSKRVDFSFQPGVIDNEYISAVLAHSTSGYFGNADFQEFFIKILE